MTAQQSQNQKHGILQTALHNFNEAASRLKLDEGLKGKILGPKERIELNLSPVMPDHRVVNIKAFVVRHNDVLGPAKGGIRMASNVTLDDVTGLAMEMTWKTSVIGVPFGGGKSGIQVDPGTISDEVKEIIIRSFTRGARRHIGPEIYVPAPDMGTNERDMARIRDCISYSEALSITDGCYVTGKPIILGGVAGRREATGKGVVYTILAMCEKMGMKVEGLRVAVQGFGNVGSVSAIEIAKRGAKIVAASDVTGAVANDDGLDPVALAAHIQKTGGPAGFVGAKAVEPSHVIEADCDVLIPAATQSQITKNNAERVTAQIVAEGANAPTTPEADEILNRRGVHVIPDILCNAGGVFVSYLEYTQETQREQMTLEEVESRLAGRMTERFRDVFETSQREGLSMRDAAMNLGVQRVVDGVLARGLLP
ncbi:MAG TPA: Glu/Leu/Phe/Val dehydrogenase [Thermoguttaceae bacterium]|nr:Glu/Leu/Phe/Val dehydrogenase [Thermoguttaceae bacterium]